jgi:hypothetical protein
MPSARVRGTVLAGIAGLALSAMFGFAPAASADTGASPGPLGLFGNTVGSTLGVVSETVGGLTGGLTGALSASAGTPTGHTRAATGATHRSHHVKRHAKKATKRRHHAVKHRSGHADRARAHRHHRPANTVHRWVTDGRAHSATPAAAARTANLTEFDSSSTPPQQNPGLLGGLLGGLLNGATSLVNGAISGVTGVVGDTTHALGQLLGGHQSSSSRPPPTHPGGGSGGTSGPGSSTPPSSSHHSPHHSPHTSPSTPGPTPAGSLSSSTHHPLGRALPAPNDVPSLISGPSRTVVPTTRPVPTPTSSSPIAQPVVPVSLTSAPGGWVLFAAVALFAIAVVFMVLGAGYRGRRAR